MGKAELIKQQLGLARIMVDGTIADVTNEMAARTPGGQAHPIGASLAHLIMSEDFVVNSMIKAGQPLLMSSHAGKTGVSEPPPQPATADWANRVKVDIPALREYAKAVHAATDEYVSALSDADLERTIEFGPMGKQPVSTVLTLIAIVHPSNHIGEVSAVKGIAGGKGYPF